MKAPSGTVTLALTDIEGSTALWERLGDRFRPVLERHNALLREAIGASGGFEFRTEGDAFCVAFARAGDAARFAVSVQQALSSERWPEAVGELRVRIGLHTGEPTLVESAGGAVDYVGQAAARAQAVAAAGHGGQILLSDPARANLEQPPGALTDLGPHRIRGIEAPVRLWQLTPPSQAGRVFPPPRTLAAVEVRLPIQNTTFVGRARELSEIDALLGGTAGITTLTGPGGCGKTRLALRAAAQTAARYPGGVWFVDCGAARTESEVAGALASALGTAAPGGEAPGAAAATLLELRQPLLLVLDAFEQAAAAAPATLTLWRQRAPHASCLVTSTRLLGLPGEYEYPVPSLDASGPDSDAVRLFVDRAREADPRFSPAPDVLADVVAIAADLDGLPLALELAASRLRVLRPAQLRQKLAQRFQLLRSARTDLPPRERTLEGALDWSYSLLPPAERAAFEQLSVLPAGFSLETAESVLDLSAFPDAPHPIDAVQQLREKSFLRTLETPAETRFAMYRSLREFGEARLAASGRADDAGRRLASWAEAFVAAERPGAGGARAKEALSRFRAEAQNLLAAVANRLAAGEAPRAARLLLVLEDPFNALGNAPSRGELYAACRKALGDAEAALRAEVAALEIAQLRGAGALDAAVAAADAAAPAARSAGATNALARIDFERGMALEFLGQPAQGLEGVQRALAPATASADPRLSLRVRIGWADLQNARHGHPAALPLLRTLLSDARTLGDPDYIAWVLYQLAPVLFRSGDVQGAIRAMEEMESVSLGMGVSKWVGRSASRIGHYLAQIGETARALDRLRDAEVLVRREGLRADLAFLLRVRGNLHRRLAQFDDAIRCYGEAEGHCRALRNDADLSSILRGQGHLHIQRGETDAAERCYREALDIATRCADKGDILFGWFDLANVARSRGDWPALLDLYRRIEPLARELHNDDHLAGALAGQADVLSMLGRGEEGIPLLDEAVRLSRSLQQPIAEGNALWFRSAVMSRLRRHPEALAAAREAMACYARAKAEKRRSAVDLYRVIAESEDAAGNRDAARRAAEEGHALVVALGLDRVKGAADVDGLEAVRRRLA